MNKRYSPQEIEQKIYQLWEEGSYFTPKIDPEKEPFTILLPPPNANDPLHMGHALYVVEDILCRWKRMQGSPTLFLPGTDHAGIETQFVYEKELAKKGKSRFDFDRETLYKMVNEYVEKNRGIAKEQMKRLGFSLDWTREKYTMDPVILKTVFETFRKLHQDGLIYRSERIVNYCTNCGTAFSDLEVKYQERSDFLYHLDYGIIQIATTRPETIFADMAVAVNPKDERYQNLIGQTAVIPIINKKIPIIADELVEIEFGTGALKITPAHDATDFEIGQKHGLEVIKVIDTHGKMINLPKKYTGMTVDKARQAVILDLEQSGQLIKTEPLEHSIGTCYRCGNTIEPLAMPQWFIDTNSKSEIRNPKLQKTLGVKRASLGELGIIAVKKGYLKVTPGRFEKTYLQWLENIRDWNISRQVVWGPRIPAWYCLDCHPEIVISFIDKNGQKVIDEYNSIREKYDFSEIKAGLQQLTAPKDVTYSLSKGVCEKCGSGHTLQETDTFDTWFSSGQWPLTTLGYPEGYDFKYFYPTSVLDTMWDILFFWVARMVMFGLYCTGEVPFRVAHMHCRIVDEKGRKMSKSKGNVINPMEMIDKYGADALRMALVFGASPGSDICIGEDKIRAMRNFANKIWNIGRFILGTLEREGYKDCNDLPSYTDLIERHSKLVSESNGEILKQVQDNKILEIKLTNEDRKIVADLDNLTKEVTELLEKYRFDLAADKIYHYVWHRFADEYIEYSKDRIKAGDKTVLSVLRHVYLSCLKLLHPFMPFVTEEIWQRFPRKTTDPLIISPWTEPIT